MQPDLETFDEYLKATHHKPKADCGTVCCIGGAACPRGSSTSSRPNREPGSNGISYHRSRKSSGSCCKHAISSTHIR